MFKKTIITITLLGSLGLLAHEGHDATPGSLKANHGGVVKAGKEINLEYVVSGTEVKLFPITHEGKDLSVTEVNLKVSAKSSKGKAETLKPEIKDGSTIVNVDFKNAYRVEMNVEAEVKGKKSTFKFQVEK